MSKNAGAYKQWSKEALFARWKPVYDSYKETFASIEQKYNNKEPEGDWLGCWAESLAANYAKLARLKYILYGDKNIFKQYLALATKLNLEVCQRYIDGDKICPSYVGLICYHELLDALASGDIALVKQYAASIGINPEYDAGEHAFIQHMGSTLKYFALGDLEQGKIHAEQLMNYLNDKKNKASEFIGYAVIYQAILAHDVATAEAGFKLLIAGHKAEANGRGYERHFKDSPDQHLSVWGLGMANLCLHYGLDINVDDPLVPKELYK